jgi:MOSC domain
MEIEMSLTSNPERVAELESALPSILAAPKDGGPIELIVRRPASDEREVLDAGVLDPAVGLVGDAWSVQPSSRTPDRSPHPDMQLTLMSSRLLTAIAGERSNWSIAGDQLYVDLDLSEENLPVGTRLGIGEALVEITAQPHTGCHKFVARFGGEALAFVNARERRSLRLRGVYAKVIRGGAIRVGDRVTKTSS